MYISLFLEEKFWLQIVTTMFDVKRNTWIGKEFV